MGCVWPTNGDGAQKAAVAVSSLGQKELSQPGHQVSPQKGRAGRVLFTEAQRTRLEFAVGEQEGVLLRISSFLSTTTASLVAY